MISVLESFRDFTDPPADDATCLRAILLPYVGVLEQFAQDKKERMAMIQAVENNTIPVVDTVLAIFSSAVAGKIKRVQGYAHDRISVSKENSYPDLVGINMKSLNEHAVGVRRGISFYDHAQRLTSTLDVIIDRRDGSAYLEETNYDHELGMEFPQGGRYISPLVSPQHLAVELETWFQSVGGVYAILPAQGATPFSRQHQSGDFWPQSGKFFNLGREIPSTDPQ